MRFTWILLLVALGQSGTVLEASRWKQVAAAAAALALLTSGEPWIGPEPLPAAEAAGQAPTCSEACGASYRAAMIHCQTLPMVLRNLCITQVMADLEGCMRTCFEEPAGSEEGDL
jgi:hypothetical protein